MNITAEQLKEINFFLQQGLRYVSKVGRALDNNRITADNRWDLGGAASNYRALMTRLGLKEDYQPLTREDDPNLFKHMSANLGEECALYYLKHGRHAPATCKFLAQMDDMGLLDTDNRGQHS